MLLLNNRNKMAILNKDTLSLIVMPKFQKFQENTELSADYFDIYSTLKDKKKPAETDFLCIISQNIQAEADFKVPLSLDYLLHFWYQVFNRCDLNKDVNIYLKNGNLHQINPKDLPESIFGYVNRKGTNIYKTREEVLKVGKEKNLEISPYTLITVEDERKELFKKGIFEGHKIQTILVKQPENNKILKEITYN